LIVNNAQRADAQPVGGEQGRACVHANFRFQFNQRIVGKAQIHVRIRHMKDIALQYGMTAKRDVAGVSQASSPWRDLNHCRSASTRLTRAVGT
jgi:hypothetical protein